jgi:hypothetical protein
MNASLGALITLDAFYSSSSTLQLDNECQSTNGYVDHSRWAHESRHRMDEWTDDLYSSSST